MKFLLVVALAAFACAEPEADPAFAYSTAGVPVLPYAYSHHALPYALPYAPVVSYAGCTNNNGALVPCALGSLVAPAVVAAPAAAAAVEEPAVGIAKREAEATAEADAEADPEADPWVYYSGVWGGHYGYAAHHYAPFSYSYAPYTHVYSHYGLPYAYYGKK